MGFPPLERESSRFNGESRRSDARSMAVTPKNAYGDSNRRDAQQRWKIPGTISELKIESKSYTFAVSKGRFQICEINRRKCYRIWLEVEDLTRLLQCFEFLISRRVDLAWRQQWNRGNRSFTFTHSGNSSGFFVSFEEVGAQGRSKLYIPEGRHRLGFKLFSAELRSVWSKQKASCSQGFVDDLCPAFETRKNGKEICWKLSCLLSNTNQNPEKPTASQSIFMYDLQKDGLWSPSEDNGRVTARDYGAAQVGNVQDVLGALWTSGEFVQHLFLSEVHNRDENRVKASSTEVIHEVDGKMFFKKGDNKDELLSDLSQCATAAGQNSLPLCKTGSESGNKAVSGSNIGSVKAATPGFDSMGSEAERPREERKAEIANSSPIRVKGPAVSKLECLLAAQIGYLSAQVSAEKDTTCISMNVGRKDSPRTSPFVEGINSSGTGTEIKPSGIENTFKRLASSGLKHVLNVSRNAAAGYSSLIQSANNAHLRVTTQRNAEEGTTRNATPQRETSAMSNLNVNAKPFEPIGGFTIMNCDLKIDLAPGRSAATVPSAKVTIADKEKDHRTEDIALNDGKEEDYAGEDKDVPVIGDFTIGKGGKARKKKKTKHKRKN